MTDALPPFTTSYVKTCLIVWIASIDSFRASDGAYAKRLSESDRERADRFRQRDDRARFILGRTLLSRALEESGCGSEPLKLKIDPKGKPSLADFPELYFSITHTGDLVGLALNHQHPVGIDIEQVRPNFENLLGHVFDEADLASFAQFSGEARATAFFQAWTGKEAYLKAVGTGLGGGLRRVHVPMEVRSSPCEIDPGEGSVWRLQTLTLPEGYAGSVVWRGPAEKVELKWVDDL